MKYNERFIIARTNDALLLPVVIAENNRIMSMKLKVNEYSLAHCIMDNCPCRNLIIDVVDMSNDLKPNTWEDYIEFCKFEKIKPCKYTSLCSYRESIEKEKALESALTM